MYVCIVMIVAPHMCRPPNQHPQVALIVFNAIYGLSISIILKRFGAITRTLISTLAIVCTAVLDYFIFSETINRIEMTSFVSIFIAIYLYSIVGKDYKPSGGGSGSAATISPGGGSEMQKLGGGAGVGGGVNDRERDDDAEKPLLGEDKDTK